MTEQSKQTKKDTEALKAWSLGALIIALYRVGEFTVDFFKEQKKK